jgi:hypothetical protein
MIDGKMVWPATGNPVTSQSGTENYASQERTIANTVELWRSKDTMFVPIRQVSSLL